MNRKAKGGRPKLEVVKTRARIGDLLRAGREEAQLDVQAAAELLGITPKELLDAENGLTEIPLQRIFAAANLYNIDPSIIMEAISEIDLSGVESAQELERISRLKI